MSTENVRFQMELPEKSYQRLRKLKDKTEATSYAEVTKNALKLYEILIQTIDDGGVVYFKDKDGNTKELQLFI